MTPPNTGGGGNVDAAALLTAQPEALNRAGQRWTELAKKFEDKMADIGRDVRSRLEDEAVWHGEGAKAASKHADDLYGKMLAYIDDITAVGKALNAAGEDVGTQKLALERLIIEIRKTPGFEIDKTAAVIERAPADQRAKVEAYVAEIEQIVDRVSAADRECAEAINQSIAKQQFLDKVLKEERKEERQEGRKRRAWPVRTSKRKRSNGQPTIPQPRSTNTRSSSSGFRNTPTST